MTGMGRRRTSQAGKIAALARVRLLEGCSKKDLALVARLANEIEVDAGAVLCEEGRIGHQFFVILDGTATVEQHGTPVRRMSAGAAFGELALLDERPRSATVKAATRMRLLIVEPRQFADLLRRVPSIAHKLLVTVTWRLRAAEEEAERAKVQLAAQRARTRAR